jgi:glycosyltransferase involved in cell wall biosynthesis
MDDAAYGPIGNFSSEQPLISVVIASVNGLPMIVECLDSLVHQEGGISSEVLVLDCCGEETRSVIRHRYPRVRLIPVEGRPSIPALRAMGMAKARGEIIAVTEDHCIAPPQWFQSIERTYRYGYPVMGGPVENGSVDRLVDWAVFFCEYAPFMMPLRRGIVSEIPGNNSAYDRRVLEALGPALHAEVWESFLHERLRERGVRFYCEPEMMVFHKKTFGFGYFLSQRYHYSRSYAGMRLMYAPWWKRLAYACATPLLPGLLLVRIAATLIRKQRFLGTFVLTLPILFVFLMSWAVGEGVGSLLGPGQSLQRVE